MTDTYPSVLQPYVADPLVRVPPNVALGHSFINEIVEVLIVRENNVASHIEKEPFRGFVRAGEASSLGSRASKGVKTWEPE